MKMKVMMIAVAGLFAAPLAQAEDVSKFEFTYVQNELATDTGRDALINRLDRQISRFCETGKTRVSVTRLALVRDCRMATRTDALKQIGLTG